MTLDDMALATLKQSRELFITPDDAAKVIGCDPNVIRIQAHDDPKKLGFPVCVVKSRTKIPRIPFLCFLGVYDE